MILLKFAFFRRDFFTNSLKKIKHRLNFLLHEAKLISKSLVLNNIIEGLALEKI